MRALITAAAALLLVGAGAVPAKTAKQKQVPSRARAQSYAHRTFINDAVLDSADGTGQIVLLFRGNRFLGWASAYDTVHLGVGRSGSSIAVRYGVFSGNDPFCCPHAIKTVRYRWNGRRIVADGTPPRSYGRKGNRLHLSPAS
jgi:LppP/LprE lipoprotein